MSTIMLTNNQPSAELEINIHDICKPLFESPAFQAYKINYFTYSRYFSDGSLYFLSTNKLLCQHHFKNKYHLIPYIEGNFIAKKFYHLPFLNDAFDKTNENFKKELFDFQEHFQMHCPIFLLERNADYLDMFMYGSQCRDMQVVNFYYNYTQSVSFLGLALCSKIC